MTGESTADMCAVLEGALRRSDGPTTILVVGARSSGKTRTCEDAFRRVGCHVVRWTPDEALGVGRVGQYFSGLDTVVFVDDADVFVGLVKGSSVALTEAMQGCGGTVRMVLTALGTKGRVWRAVAARAGMVLALGGRTSPTADAPPTSSCDRRPAPKKKTDAWARAVRAADTAVVARSMLDWSIARDAEDEVAAGRTADDAADGRGWDVDDDAAEDDGRDGDRGCDDMMRTIARILVSSTSHS